jgi:hypothetical protein
MSGLCKVEMSGFIQGGRRDGTGANRVERERTGAAYSLAASRRRSSEADRRAQRLRLNDWQVRRLHGRLRAAGDGGIAPWLSGCCSKIAPLGPGILFAPSPKHICRQQRNENHVGCKLDLLGDKLDFNTFVMHVRR